MVNKSSIIFAYDGNVLYICIDEFIQLLHTNTLTHESSTTHHTNQVKQQNRDQYSGNNDRILCVHCYHCYNIHGHNIWHASKLIETGALPVLWNWSTITDEIDRLTKTNDMETSIIRLEKHNTELAPVWGGTAVTSHYDLTTECHGVINHYNVSAEVRGLDNGEPFMDMTKCEATTNNEATLINEAIQDLLGW